MIEYYGWLVPCPWGAICRPLPDTSVAHHCRPDHLMLTLTLTIPSRWSDQLLELTSHESFFPSAYPAQRKDSRIVFLWPEKIIFQNKASLTIDMDLYIVYNF